MDSDQSVGPLELVHTTLMRMGFNPSVMQSKENVPSVLTSPLQENPGEVGASFFNCAESQDGEICLVFTAPMGELEEEVYWEMLRFCNGVHAEVHAPGTLFFNQGDDGDPEWFLNMRFLLRVDTDLSTAVDVIEETVDELTDFFNQAKWAAYELLTGGELHTAIEMLEIGETYAEA